MNVSGLFNRHVLHFFGVVRPSFSSQKLWFRVTISVFFEQKPGLIFRFWRVFRNLLGFDNFQSELFSQSILFLELVFSENLTSLFNSLPHGKGGQGVENALKPEAMGGFKWVSWADKSDPDPLNALVITRKEEWLL
jgi:hypothetical protein